MSDRDEFEKWAYPAYSLEKRKDGNYKRKETRVACAGFESRQPEIDALTKDRDLFLALIGTQKALAEEIDKERIALKAENEKLRKDAERLDFINLMGREVRYRFADRSFSINHVGYYGNTTTFGIGSDVRKAIDASMYAAMKETK